MSIQDEINTLRRAYYRAKSWVYYRHIFASLGSRSIIFPPLLLSHPEFIHIGANVLIRPGARLEAVPQSGRKPELRIGNNVNIEQNVHLICHSRLIIGNNVSITGHCAVVDTTHPYEDIYDPRKIGDRILDEDSFVEIGDGSFLGFGSIVMPNVRIGEYSVIGAHSVVTKDVPGYSVAAGNPAKIVKRYDKVTETWC